MTTPRNNKSLWTARRTTTLRIVSLTELKVENAAALNKDLTTTYALDATHFATTAGTLLMVRPRVLGSFAFNVDRKKRNVPIDLRETMRGTDEFDIALPDGVCGGRVA